MSVSINGKTIEYTKPQITVSASASDASSIFNKLKDQKIEKAELSNKLLYFNSKLEKLIANYKGITLDDIQQIRTKLGFDKLDIENITEERVNRIIERIKKTLDECVVNGVVDLKKYENLLKKRKEEFEFLNSGCINALIKKGYLQLKEGETAKDITDEDLQKAVEKFLNEEITKIKQNAKNLTPQAIEAHLKKFDMLLDSTDKNDLTRFWNAVKRCLTESGCVQIAITKIIRSCDKNEDVKIYLKEIAQEDMQTLGINPETLVNAIHDAGSSDDPHKITDILSMLIKARQEIDAENNEISKKIKEYCKNNNITDTNIDNETLKQILNEEEYNKHIASQNLKNNMPYMVLGALKRMQKDGIEIPEDIESEINNFPNELKTEWFNKIKEYLENHKDELNIEDIETYINQLTKGEYASVTGSELTYTEPEKSCGGFGVTDSPCSNNSHDTINILVNNLTTKIDDLYNNTSDNNKITVEKIDTKSNDNIVKTVSSISGMSASQISEGIKNGLFKSVKDAMLCISKEYNRASSSAKTYLENYISNMSDSCKAMFLHGIDGSALVQIVEHTGIDTEKLKIKSDYNTTKALEKIEEQKDIA